MAIPKKVEKRIKEHLRRYRGILDDARRADRSEQDTVTIVTDMLADLFGYDKYSEITGEYAIRGTYCDIAVKVGGKIRFLIEVKAIGKDLKENHLRQATDYAAKEGIEWVILSNGIEWQAYRMIFEQPVRFDHVFSLEFNNPSNDFNDLLYMLSREGISKNILDDFHEQKQILNAHHLAALILSDRFLSVLRRELRKLAPGMKVDCEAIKEELETKVIKLNVIDSEELKEASKKVKRSFKKMASRKANQTKNDCDTTERDVSSATEQPANS